MTTSAPRVSIVIPVWNASKTLGALLESIHQQTYPHLETIAVDDASSDRSVEQLQAYGATVIRNPRNLGMTKTRNAAARQARGEYVLFLDSDMELTPHVVEACVEMCEQQGFDAATIPERSIGGNFWSKCRGLDKQLIDDDPLRSASRFFRRSVLEAIGEHDERLIAAEDFDFDMRMREAGFRSTMIPHCLYHHEVATLRQMIRKTFRYGQTAPSYFAKRPVIAMKQFFVIRPAYLRNWRVFLQHPAVGGGLIVLKIAQYAAGLAGAVVAVLKSAWPARYSEAIEARQTGRTDRSVWLCGDVERQVVLNIGARNGWLEQALVDRGAQRVVGIDLNGAGLRLARQAVPSARWSCASALSLPFRDQTFDLVTVFEVLEHLPVGTEAQALQEIRRVLKPNGRLVGSTPYQHWLANALDPAWWLVGHRHYAIAPLRHLIETAGLRLTRWTRAGGLAELLGANALYLFKVIQREVPGKPWLEALRAREYLDRRDGIATLFFIGERG